MVDAKIDEQIAMKSEILQTIMKLSDRRHRLILMEYYIEMKTFEQVAVDMNYSWRQIMNIHGHALKEVERCLNS